MSDERFDEALLAQVRETYHVPGETPREAMWGAIEARLGGDTASRAGTDVVDLTAERARRGAARPHLFRSTDRGMGWAVAAAALLVLGVGIGRMTAPTGPAPQAEVAPDATTRPANAPRGGLALAAREHLGRTESLLTMVRADARDGRVDPVTVQWAEGLLAETRLLLDANGGSPAVDDLLLDLELVLIQIAAVAESETMDEARARTELGLALRTLEEGEVLPRIQAVLPDLSGV